MTDLSKPKGLLQIDPNTQSGQIKKMNLLLVRKVGLKLVKRLKCDRCLCVLESVLLPNLTFQDCSPTIVEPLVLGQFNHWRDVDVDHESLDSWILAEWAGLSLPLGRKKCVFLLTVYCHGCNMFGNSETHYISIMGKRGLTVYFIASNSVLCLCACVSADSGFLALLIRLVADENRSDERYIQYTLSLVWVELT